MTKANLKVGMMVVTENGVKRLVMPTKESGLVLISADNRILRLEKLNEDLTRGRYKAGNDVVQVYDIMNDADGELFSSTGRDLLFDREEDIDKFCDCHAGFTKADIAPGMLAVTRDGKNRLAIPTSDKGLVLADEDSKFVRLDKLNDNLTIRDYNKEGKNVDQVYGLAAGVTTDFYSTDNRPLLFDRDAD